MSPYADVALWVGLSIGLLIIGALAVLIWRIRRGPRTLDYPSDEAYYAAKAREALTPEPGGAGSVPAASREEGRSGVG